MNSLIRALRLPLYTALIAAYIINIFVHSPSLNYFVGVLVVGCILISFTGANKLYLILSSIFLISAIVLHQFTEVKWLQLPVYMTSSVLLIALLYFLPFIQSVFKIGRYDQQISKLIKMRISHFGQLYYKTSFVSYLLSSFLFFAAIPIVYDVVIKHMNQLQTKLKQKFISQVILRGFGMAMIWSPIEILVALACEMTNVSYLSLLPWLIVISLLMLAIDWSLGWRYKSIKHDMQGVIQIVNKVIVKKIVLLLLALFLFITSAAIVHKALNVSFFTGITLIILPYSLVWAALISRFRSYVYYSFLVWKKRTPDLNQFALFFLSIGFFNGMVDASGLMNLVYQPMQALTSTPLLLFIAVQLLSLLLTLVGFHPLVTISLFGLLLQPLLTTMNPVSIAILLITSNLATASAGTYNTTVTFISSFLKISPYRVTWWNMGFALLFGGMGTTLAYLML